MSGGIRWGEEALQRQLEPLLPGITVEVVRQVRSTNSALIDRARGTAHPPPADPFGAEAFDGERPAGDVVVRRSVESTAFGRRAIDLQPCLLVAEHQTAGRGRQGRSWQSAAGASLTFSLALPLAAADLSGLSLAAGVAVADALDGEPFGEPAGECTNALGGESIDALDGESVHPPGDEPVAATTPDRARARIALKWPNDIWLLNAAGRGRKLGGVLIETLAAGPRRLVVIGIGLNVRHFDAEEVTTGFATLDERDPCVTAEGVLARVALPLVQALKRFEREGFAGFAARFDTRDMLRGKEVTTTLPEAPHGTASGVSAHGALLLRTPEGTLLPVTSGEVSVRLAVPAA